jgi:alkanesulfonate monooxygenase SsuD/methylene tetrahydromethanopterin reductase-like flavin-dependent oxidoreductase (luciferase family)
MACTLDILSDGRLEYGLGAGWRESECTAYGLPYPSPKERVERLRESAVITKKMWTETPASYSGRYYKIEKLYCVPKSTQRPHPPLLIAGTGDKILGVTAELADKHNMFAGTPEIKGRLESLKRHCRSAGRKLEDIELTLTFGISAISSEHAVMRKQLESYYVSSKEGVSWDGWLTELKRGGLVGTPDECVRRINEFKQLGITHFILRFADFPLNEGMRTFALSVKDLVK